MADKRILLVILFVSLGSMLQGCSLGLPDDNPPPPATSASDKAS